MELFVRYNDLIASNEFKVGQTYKIKDIEFWITAIYTHHCVLTDGKINISYRKLDLRNNELIKCW